MKKIITILTLILISINVIYAADEFSKDYLQNTKHFSIVNPFAENIIEHAIKKSLYRECKGSYKVHFTGYTLASIKEGIFKKLIITGKNLNYKNINIPYVRLETNTDYNYIQYKQTPIKFKSDMCISYNLHLSEDSINEALKQEDYNKNLNKINNIAYPLFEIKGASIKITNDKLYILTEYNFPIAPSSRNKVFVASSDMTIVDGKIKAHQVKLNSAYGNVSLRKVANLLNLLNPLEYTISLLSTEKNKGYIENVKIIDNIIQINGKIYIKGE